MMFRVPGGGEFKSGPEWSFRTRRAKSSEFIFEVLGDTHPERTPKQNDPALYAKTLLALAADKPDFFFCLGDDFSVDQLREVSKTSVRGAYLKQLPYMGLAASSSALYLVNGNHEQAARCNLDGTPDNVAVWAQNSRNSIYPQPGPDGFYTGNKEEVEHIGLPRDYYAWSWGDALFVVIDPYWHSPKPVDNVFGGGKKNRDLWDVTLGEAQYRWFKETLEKSGEKFKFVFIHQLVGGLDGAGRGGSEAAILHEWGGRDISGKNVFPSERPGWEKPVHDLLVETNVTIVFHGHDHFFARQQLDGVVYQLVPQPAHRNFTSHHAGEYGYKDGDFLPSSGHLLVRVSPAKADVSYVLSATPGMEKKGRKNGATAFHYECAPK